MAGKDIIICYDTNMKSQSHTTAPLRNMFVKNTYTYMSIFYE